MEAPTAWLFDAHPWRDKLVNELHTRPSVAVAPPLRVSHLALLVGEEDDGSHRQHFAALCERMGAIPPGPTVWQHQAQIGNVLLRWEQHTEFATYSIFRSGAFSEPFASTALTEVPIDWLSKLPGKLLVAIHINLLAADAPPVDSPWLEALFGTDRYVGAMVKEAKAQVWTDFRLHGDGFVRLLVKDQGLSGQQAGRLLRDLLELETYRTLALLAFPVALEARTRLHRLESQLDALTLRIPELRELAAEQALLAELTELSIATARLLEETTYRFAAARAYHGLVLQRVQSLRETRLPGVPTIGGFMDRRLGPAMKTCTSVSARIDSLNARISHTSGLLRTVVDVALQAQNRDLLRAMNRRARMQLQLQRLVEGLSVLAISHYALGLLSLLLGSLPALGVNADRDLIVGLAVPVVVPSVWWGTRRLTRRVMAQGTD